MSEQERSDSYEEDVSQKRDTQMSSFAKKIDRITT